MNLLEQIPGLREAIDQERFERNSAFIQVNEFICGIEIVPLTLRHVATLDAVGSPFVTGGPIQPTDVAATLWLLSANYNPKAKLARWLFLRRCRGILYLDAIRGLDAYFAAAFSDSLSENSGESISYFSAYAGTVHVLASKYNWSEADILDLPVKRIFQYVRAISDTGKKVFFNPSDKVRGQWLEKQNQGDN